MSGVMYLGNQMVTPVIVKGNAEYVGREITSEGVYQIPENVENFVLPEDIKDVGTNALRYATSGVGYKTVNLNKLKKATGDYAFQYFNNSNSNLELVDSGDLEEVIGRECFGSAFIDCPNLKTVLLSKVKKVTGYQAFNGCFNRATCANIERIDLSSLEEVGSNGLYQLFIYDNKITSVDVPKLKKLQNASLQSAFRECNLSYIEFLSLTDLTEGWYSFSSFVKGTVYIYFWSLTPESFSQEHTSVFANMLSRTINAVVFFPRSVESVIGNWSDILAGCGGTNSTIMFYTPTRIKVETEEGIKVSSQGYLYKQNYVVVSGTRADFVCSDNSQNKNVLCSEIDCTEGEERTVNVDMNNYNYIKVTVNIGSSYPDSRLIWNNIEIPMVEESEGVCSCYINDVVGETLLFKNDGGSSDYTFTQEFQTTGDDITLTIEPNPKETRTFTRPNLTANGTLGGEAFAVTANTSTSNALEDVSE